jgi:hypothetical protein
MTHRPLAAFRAAATLLASTAVVLALAAPALAKSPVRFTPDGTAILVNKDVGNQRWTVTLDAERATVTGNVSIGDRVSFIWCGITDATGDEHDLANQTLIMHCFDGDPCADLASCAGFEGWHSIGEVRLSGSFFLP